MGSGIGKRAHEKALGALDRIGLLEQGLQQVINGTQESFMLTEQRLQYVEELLQAAVAVAGPDLVKDQIVATRKAKQEARVEAAKKAVATAVEKQQLLPLAQLPDLAQMSDSEADKKLTNILVVGREMDAEGNVAAPGRVQQPLSNLLPEVRVALADQGPGVTIDVPGGRKFTLDEIYIENPNPPVPAETLPTEAAIEAEIAGTENS